MFDKLLDRIAIMISWFSGWWERHICMDYEKTNLPYECANCNLGNCKGCPLEGMTRTEVEAAKAAKTLRTNKA